MENKKLLIALSVLVLSSMLFFAENLESVYALTVSSFSITGSPNQFFKVGNVEFSYNTTTDAFRQINLLTGIEVASATTTITGTSYIGLRCNATDCWIMSITGNTDCYIQRFSSIGALEETLHLTNDCSGSSDMGLGTTTIYFGRKCTTGDIGSSGAGDTDLAVFSVDGNSMTGGSPVQHTDCGANFTPISSSSQGLIGYAVTGTRLAVITNGAVGAADIFTYINLAQSLSSSSNTQLCQVTMTGNSFSSATGRNFQFISNDAYVLVNSGGDSFTLNSLSSTCAKTIDSYSAFNTGQANIGLAPDLDILYIGGTEADGTGLLVNAYDFASNTATTTLLFSVTPDSTATATFFDYSSTRDTGYILGTSTIWVIEFGGVSPEEEGGNQQDGVCGNGTALECVGDRGTLGNIFYGTGGTSQPITNVTNNLLNGLGVTNATNTDVKTNGTGLFLMLLTGVFFFIASVASVAVANAKFNANIQYSDSAMNAYWLLFLVIAVVAIAYYLQWIPDIIFYGLVVGLAGLFSFGAYRHFKSGG